MEGGGEDVELGSDQAHSCTSAAVNRGQELSPHGSPRRFRKQAANKRLRRHRRFTVANTW